ncbi:hypothetical protein [Pseudodesulfovibrio senegalensis]|uniref:Uncharacterized protein n=1 Tax=Pseudodesulfovibrio senegalensis TaxID=1721087 RepID=A0A6N6N4M8_9BACT|nr:hypothetical protein [Pseudodesulfovibrio senegalensis]KAB1442913.1 hypothetical protein F8A88_01155 [Pseudodesulfovibrio senegalensis]
MIKSVSLKAAVRDTVRIFQFEQWIRFYYIKGEEENMSVEIPDDVLQRVEKEYPTLKSLAETMVGDIDYKKSHEIVCAHVASHMDGAKYDPTIMPKVFDSPQFKIEMYVFNMWMKMHEPYLDEEVMFFSDWEEMWEEWNKLDEVKQYREKLVSSGQTPSAVQ